jgi:two-component system chemotaxis sensor kinase CheA
VDEVIKEFLVESTENLLRMEHGLVNLEKDPTNREILADIFRTVHTIKGTCGFFEFSKLEALSHISENLLSRARDGELDLDSKIISTLLELVDKIRQFLSCIESTGSDNDVEAGTLVEKLSGLAQRSRQEQAPARPKEKPPRQAKKPKAQAKKKAAQPAQKEAAPVDQKEAAPVEKQAKKEAPVSKEAAQPIAAATRKIPEPEEEAPPDLVEEHSFLDDSGLPPEISEHVRGISSTSVRVDVSLLEKLMGMVGELVLARNQILQLVAERDDQEMTAMTQRLNMVTSGLQEAVMRTRMQPIDNVFQTFPRLVRDMTLVCGKKVRLEIEGKETELDRTIIEAIKDPLTHLARNAIDHGIEEPAERLAQGKPEEGCIQLRAKHENGQVIIEINDNGSGVNVDAIKQKARKLQLASAEELDEMSRQEALNLIFAPGLSTASRVTSVSGRGVGMDVVKTNIERVGGTVDLHSMPSVGTSIQIRLPLTLAIMPALIVRGGNQRYAIPQSGLVELVRIDEKEDGGIEHVHDAPVFRLRDKLLPILWLDEELGLKKRKSERASDSITIVVLRAADREFGLVVDRLEETQEIVVKPLGDLLKRIPILAGTTILGDGRVALILDVLGLALGAHVVTESTERTSVAHAAQVERASDKQKMLFFASRDDGRMAIPLDRVSRLVEFNRDAVERAGDYEVIQYGTEILPLLHVDSLLPERRQARRTEEEAEDGRMQVVVYAGRDRDVGLVVCRILDIVEEPLTLQQPASRDGVLGTAVIRGRVTELLDVEGMIRKFDPSFVLAELEAEG